MTNKNSLGEEKWDAETPKWYLDILEQRLEEYRKNPSSGRSWEEVKEEYYRKRHQERNSKN